MINKILTFLLFVFVTSAFGQHTLTQEQRDNLPDNQRKLYERIYNYNQARLSRIDNYIENNPLTKKVYEEDNSYFVLYDIVDNHPMYRTTDNTDSAVGTKTNTLQVGGELNLDLDGTGIKVGVWDGGPIQASHPEFQDGSGSSRINVIDIGTTGGDSGDDFHATHVGGTIGALGVDPDAKGMATNVVIDSYNFNNDAAEMVGAQTVPNAIILSNHSYGVPVSSASPWQMGAYISQSRNIDDIAAENPKYLIVFSAGNDGNTTYSGGLYTNSDKLVGSKVAKNNLVIANANTSINPFTGELDDYVINSSSSQGPTDDIRVKPDLTADGTGVYSANVNGGYSTLSGTSMAAPNVTGTLALIQQYWEQLNGEYMNSSTLKGLVCHTALDDVNTSGPDHIFGWGLLDAKFAAETITKSTQGTAIIEELTLIENSTYSIDFTAQAGDKLSATICWTDVPGTAVSGQENLNNPTPRLVNDLDIRITKDGQTFFPWRLDYDSGSGFSNSKGDNIVDNVEKIDIDLPVAGSYTLTVSHKGSLQTSNPFDSPAQDFALIVTGNNVTLGTDDSSLPSISLYPNPTTDFINIQGLTTPQNFELYSIQGKSIMTGQLDSQNNRLNLDTLSRGIYIIKIGDGNNFITEKIIKK